MSEPLLHRSDVVIPEVAKIDADAQLTASLIDSATEIVHASAEHATFGNEDLVTSAASFLKSWYGKMSAPLEMPKF